MLARGFSLTELLMALGTGAIVITAGGSLVSTIISRSVALDRQQSLVEEALLLKRTIRRELQRAGSFSASLPGRLALRPNPFASEWQIASHPDEPADSCVLFAYDKNQNGELDLIPSERYGLRLRNSAIELRVAGRSCQQNGWQDLTSPDIRVTRFEITALTPGPTLIHISMTLGHRNPGVPGMAQEFAVSLPNYVR